MSVQDKDGILLQDAEQVKMRWKEYVEDLYQAKNRPKWLGQDTVDEGEEETGPELLKEKILSASNDMKNNKAERIDNILAEILKSLGEKALKELIQLFKDIYRTGKWPEDFLQTILIPLKKKANAVRCEEYRTISLLTHASKVLLRVLTKRLQAKVQAGGCLGEDQFGFRKGRGTRDAIGALRMMAERSLENNQVENNQEICICFVDCEMRKEDVKRIEAFEMWIWRGMERIGWTEHRTNEEVKRSLMDIIRTRQKNWIGHILRGSSLQREIMDGRMEGKRGRGRPREKFMDWMKEVRYGKLKEKAQHREEWSCWTLGPAGRQIT